MKEAFDLIRKQLDEQSVMRANSEKFYSEPQNGEHVDCVVLLKDALSIVSEVEAEYTKERCTRCYLGSPCEYQNEDVRIPDELTGWIPCSERLPKIRQDCLVTVKYSGFLGMHGFWVKTGHMEAENDWCGDCFGGTVIAWMPLPSPYKPTTD